MKQNLSSHTGFSLIELLVALSILAVVTALIVPRFLNVREQAAETTANAQIKSLNSIYNQWVALGGEPGNSTAYEVIAFLNMVPEDSSSVRGASGDCEDTYGDFASTSIMLSGVEVTTGAPADATDSDGFYSTGGPAGACGLKVGNYIWDVTFDDDASIPFDIDNMTTVQ